MALEQVLPAPCGALGAPDSLVTWIERLHFLLERLITSQFFESDVYHLPRISKPPRRIRRPSCEGSVILVKPSSKNGGLHEVDTWPSEGPKITMAPSWYGGFDINIGSHIIRLPKYLSVQNSLVQMVLSAAYHVYGSIPGGSVQDGSKFRCPKVLVPKCDLDMVNGSRSSAKGRQASAVSANRELGKAGEDGATLDKGARGSVSCEGTHDQKIFKLSKTDDGAPGSERDKTDWQQQQDTLTEVNHVGPINLGENSADSGSCVICETGCKIISGLAAAEHLNEQNFLNDDAEHRQQRGNGVWANSTTQEKRAGHHGEQNDHSTVLNGRCGGAYVVTAENAISIALKNNHPATACWFIASAVPHHATGNRHLLSGFAPVQGDLFVKTGDAGAAPMRVVGTGNVVTDAVVLPDLWYVPGLVANLVSVSQLAELDYSVAFGGGRCYVRSVGDDGMVAGAARAGEDGLFALDFIRVPLGL